jgi:hypothetical protein
VVAGQQIATFYPGSSIEIGWSDASGSPLASSVYTEGMVTQQGKSFLKFLHSLGGGHNLNHQFSALLQPGQWRRVIQRIGQLPTPSIQSEPSKQAVRSGTHH